MEVRRERLGGYIEYFLDCSTEVGEIDGCTSDVLRLYGDQKELQDIIESMQAPRTVLINRYFDSRQTTCRALMAMADLILTKLPPERCGALIFSGISSLVFRIKEFAEYMADTAIVDMIEGGSLKPFRKGRFLLQREDRHGNPRKRVVERLHSRSFIRRYIKEDDSAKHKRDVANTVLRRVCLVDRSLIAHSPEIVADLRGQLSVPVLQDNPEHAPSFKPGTPQYRARARRKRKMLRRGALVGAAIIGASSVGALARGEPVQIDGPTVSLQVSRTTSLASMGHGALDVALVTHDGTKLADLCVYFEGTPAIDQLAAFALYMQSGLEKELLETANVTRATPEGLVHPILVDRAKARDWVPDAGDIRDLRSDAGFHATWERRRERNQAYWEETKSMWIEAVAMFCFRRASIWRSLTETSLKVGNG